MRRVAIGALLAAGLGALALLTIWPKFGDPVRWTPDALFYQARLLEVRGATADGARAQAFEGPLSADVRLRDPTQTGDPAWVLYNEPFYERRQTVPLAGAALYPVAGERSLLYVSLAGYVAAVLAVFTLLALRFRLAVAAAVALATVFLPALTFHSGYPLTDSWGLALQAIALAAAVLTLERSPRWLALWIGVLVVLSLTRDSAWIPVLAAVFVALRDRSRLAAALAGTGIAASLPALLLFPVSARELLALAVNGSQPAPDASWSFVAENYPAALLELVRSNGGFVRDGAWYTAAYMLGGLLLLCLLDRGARGARPASLLRAAAVVSPLAVLAVPVFSAFRLELVCVPMAAFGLALGVERLAERLALPERLRRLQAAYL